MMSAADSPKAQFRRAAYRVIVMSINRRLSKLSKPTLRLTWRLGVNLYGTGKYFDAYKQLSDVCSAIESKDPVRLREIKVDFRDKISSVYLMAARCCFKMFIQTEQHHHLENAYHKYEHSIKSLTIDFLTAIRLPAILFEFSRVLENYGSFESALKTHGKILTAFPSFKGYFDVMYRSAIVGKFVAGKVQDPVKQQEMIRQCIDMIQFLLEAVPPTINELHLVFLLCVTLEASSESSYRFQINDAFKMLHKLCKSTKPTMFSADEYRDYKEWLTNDPYLWYNVGTYFLKDNEVLLARDAFAMFMKRAAATDEKLSVDVLLAIAKNCARFQNYEEAVACADRGLQVDHFHKETRSLLAQWSEIRRAELELEESSAAAIVKVWKGRLWQPGYRRRYAKIVVSDLEQTMSMSNTQYSAAVRNELAYFARDKWRARFLFEDECARRIQRTFRGAKLILSMARVGREKYRMLANEIHAKILKKPFDAELRKEIYRIVAHKFCPKHHAIIGFSKAMREQEAAHAVIRKNVNIWRLKKRLHERHYAGLYREQLTRAYAAVDIQKIIRMKLALRRTDALRHVKARRHNAARVIQRFVRHRNSSLRHSVTRLLDKVRWKRKKAANMVAVFVIGKIKRRRSEKARIRLERNSAKKIQRMFRQWKRRRLEERERRRKAFIIQAFFRGNSSRATTKLALRLLRKRRKVSLSHFSHQLVRSVGHVIMDQSYVGLVQNQGCSAAGEPELIDLAISGGGVGGGEQYMYRNPGVRQGTPMFLSVLNQPVVICSGGRDFCPADCMLLCGLLRNPLCRINRVVFQNIDGRHTTYEFDLVQAIGKCISLRSVVVLGGQWSAQFLNGLLEAVQKINPRVTEVLIEDMKYSVFTPPELSSVGISGGKLIGDFFNYSVPGLKTLSLHGLGLRDEHMTALVAGLGVNSSIQTLVLSANLLEDDSLASILRAITANKRSMLTVLDYSWNLVTGLNSGLSAALKNYKNTVFGMQLCILLFNNHMRYHMEASQEYRHDLKLFYDFDEIKTLAADEKRPKKSPKRGASGSKLEGVERTAAIPPSTNRKGMGGLLHAKGNIKFKSKPTSILHHSKTFNGSIQNSTDI